MSIEAMKLAIDVFDKIEFYSDGGIRRFPSESEAEYALSFLRQAIAEESSATQEPVAWMEPDWADGTIFRDSEVNKTTDFFHDFMIPLYTHPQSKAEQERCKNCESLEAQNTELDAKLAYLEKQEPVAYITNKRQRMNVELKPHAFVWMPTTTDWEIPLYTHPQQKAEQDPKREWVGLTIGEIQDLIQFKEQSPFALAEDIEAKLKAKNERKEKNT